MSLRPLQPSFLADTFAEFVHSPWWFVLLMAIFTGLDTNLQWRVAPHRDAMRTNEVFNLVVGVVLAACLSYG